MLIFATSAGTPLGNWDRETKALQQASRTAGWTRHDLRRTGATMLGEMGELPDIIEAALNHVSIRSPLAATYNRSRYRPQVAAALQRLADALDGVETGDAKVVPLHGLESMTDTKRDHRAHLALVPTLRNSSRVLPSTLLKEVTVSEGRHTQECIESNSLPRFIQIYADRVTM